MSFLLDFCLLILGLGVVAWYAKRSIFAAWTGLVSVAVGMAAAMFLTGFAVPFVSQSLVAPLVERTVANELADMYSAPHESGGRDTVKDLPLHELIEQEPEAYTRLLAEYSVSPATVRAAYEKEPTSAAILQALTAAHVEAFSWGLTFVVLSVVLVLLLRLLFHRVEQNFPPTGRYHGLRRVVPALFGIPTALVVLWGVVVVLCWLAPVLGGQTVWISEEILDAAGGFSLLRRCDPFWLIH